jgi:hypothetical protein
LGLEPNEDLRDRSRRQLKSTGGVRNTERAMGAGKPADHITKRVGDRFEQGRGDARRGSHAQSVPQLSNVLDGDVALASPDPNQEDAALFDQSFEPGWRLSGVDDAGADIIVAERTK